MNVIKLFLIFYVNIKIKTFHFGLDSKQFCIDNLLTLPKIADKLKWKSSKNLTVTNFTQNLKWRLKNDDLPFWKLFSISLRAISSYLQMLRIVRKKLICIKSKSANPSEKNSALSGEKLLNLFMYIYFSLEKKVKFLCFIADYFIECLNFVYILGFVKTVSRQSSP